MKIIKGTSACDGIAVGSVYYFKKMNIDISDNPGEVDRELEHFHDAVKQADERLEVLYNKALKHIGEEEAEIFDVHRLMLADDDYIDAITDKITNGGMNALKAVKETCTEFAAFFEELEDAYMRARATDIRDISGLLLQILAGVSIQEELSKPSIIIADDLTPSETVQMNKDYILAFVTRKGSYNSHTAILARTMGIPSIVQADFVSKNITPGMEAAVDGFDGICYFEPDEPTLAALEEKRVKSIGYKRECEAVRGLPTISKSGKSISIYANIGRLEDIALALENDAEGIGLFRSEFLFLGRDSPPGEQMQFEAYKEVAASMGGKKVIVRTMDIGADKQVDYLGLSKEENPALGYRAIRVSLDQDKLFQEQLRAICRASAYGNISIMFPMISSLWEIRECKNALQRAQESLTKEGIPFGEMEVGIMIEIPAAVILRDEFAKEVDFFSVGTNDLTQYTLAVDRQNQSLGRYADPHHPAILEMLRIIAECAIENGIWAGICGELAGDLKLTDKFLEFGYNELSVAPPMVLPLRKAVRDLS